MKPWSPKAPVQGRLFIKARVPPERVLLYRIILLVVLVSMVLGIFWWDRDGLRDQIDGDISFSDVAYFTAVTITTVGYGDIVPVTDRARIVDTLFVTPLRLVIWLVFLGTAYELVLQHWLENRRMNRIQQSLKSHLIICGYGHSGQSAAQEAVARGTPASQILVMERDEARLKMAAACGYIGLLSDPTHEDDLRDAGIANAQAVLMCLGRDDAAVLAVLTVRQLNSQVRVICSAAEAENVKLLRQAGADAIVSPSMVGGYLMADSVQSSHIADYVSDLMCRGGRVHLRERSPLAGEIGLPMREIGPGLVVRIIRADQRIGFWEGERARVQEADRLLVIEHN